VDRSVKKRKKKEKKEEKFPTPGKKKNKAAYGRRL